MSSVSRLCVWVKTNRLLDETHDAVFNSSVNEIINALGGIKSMLLELTKSLKMGQLKAMHSIISTEQRKFNAQNKNKLKLLDTSHVDMQIDVEEDDESNNKSSLFLCLPNECLSHICGYLDKSNIKSFKLTSRQNGIICLQEMQKVPIGAINIDNPFDNINKNDLNNLYHLTECCKINRHSTAKRFYSLFEEWELKYNIPQQYQLIFLMTDFSFSLIDSQTVRLTQIPSKPSKYLIADKRNIIIWNNNNNNNNHNYNNHMHKIMILEYFNVFTQTSHIAQIIMYETTNKPSYNSLLKYIMNSKITGVDNVAKQIRVYGHDAEDGFMVILNEEKDLSQYNKFTFQFNENNENNNVDGMEIYPNAEDFCHCVSVLKVECENNISHLKSCINHYNATSKLSLDINLIDKQHSFQMSQNSFISRIKQKISQCIFNGVVLPKYIEITNSNEANILDNYYIQYKINLYDTKIHDNNEYCTDYILRIFAPLNCPYPYYIGEEEGILFNIKYKKDFIIKDFLNYIFQTIKNGKNNQFLYHQFRELIPLLDDENNCILAPHSYEYITPYHFNERYIYCSDLNTNFDLFLFNHNLNYNNNQDNIKLEIKFISNSYICEPDVPPFPVPEYTAKEYISQSELSALQIGDEIYHRDYQGYWCLAQIISKNNINTKVKIHYIRWKSKWDVWCDIETDCHRFARANIHPYSTHSAQNMNGYVIGDDIFYNPQLSWYGRNVGGWIDGKIGDIKPNGSVKISNVNPKYYTHIDNTDEIRKYKPIEKTCNMSKYHRNEMIKHKDNPNGMVVNNKFKRFIGLPLTISIDKEDKLDKILNKYLMHSKDFIMTIYRVKYGDKSKNKLISISKNKRNSYKPYHEFIKKYPNDFILIKLKKCNNKKFNIPIYPKSIIGGQELICSNKKEMEMIIKLLFEEKYSDNNLSEKISRRLMQIYDEKNIGWDDIVNDFNDVLNENDCFSVNYVVGIFIQHDIAFDKKYIWGLLKRCKPIQQ